MLIRPSGHRCCLKTCWITSNLEKSSWSRTWLNFGNSDDAMKTPFQGFQTRLETGYRTILKNVLKTSFEGVLEDVIALILTTYLRRPFKVFKASLELGFRNLFRNIFKTSFEDALEDPAPLTLTTSIRHPFKDFPTRPVLEPAIRPFVKTPSIPVFRQLWRRLWDVLWSISKPFLKPATSPLFQNVSKTSSGDVREDYPYNSNKNMYTYGYSLNTKFAQNL